MPDLSTLPLDIQITIVAGYFGYKVYVAGRGATHGAEEVILQALAFGILGRMAASLLKAYASLVAGPRLSFPGYADAVLLTVASVAMSIALAALWRTKGSAAFSKLMRNLGIYSDDHEYSTWASITSKRAQWNYIQLHLIDGRVLESTFSELPSDPLGDRITTNTDGFAIYITATYDKLGNRTAQSPLIDGSAMAITYVPRSSVAQVDLGWQRR